MLEFRAEEVVPKFAERTPSLPPTAKARYLRLVPSDTGRSVHTIDLIEPDEKALLSLVERLVVPVKSNLPMIRFTVVLAAADLSEVPMGPS